MDLLSLRLKPHTKQLTIHSKYNGNFFNVFFFYIKIHDFPRDFQLKIFGSELLWICYSIYTISYLCFRTKRKHVNWKLVLCKTLWSFDIYEKTFLAQRIIPTTGKTMKTKSFVFLMKNKLVFFNLPVSLYSCNIYTCG